MRTLRRALRGRCRPARGHAYFAHPGTPARATTEDQRMSKGMDRKKEQKKKPAKTMKEKKAEKKEKKTGKGFAPV